MVAINLFDKPDTCGRVWDRILSGSVLEALRTETGGGSAVVGDAIAMISAAGNAAWDEVTPVGEGEEFRSEFKDDQGSALRLKGHSCTEEFWLLNDARGEELPHSFRNVKGATCGDFAF